MPAGPLCFAWLSSGQRHCLADCAGSFLSNLDAHGDSSPVFFSFDGPFASILPDVAERLSALARVSSRPFFVIDRDSRASFLKSLPSFYDDESLRWALLPERPGRGAGLNRSAIALATAGSIVVSSDDDLYCAPAVPVGMQIGSAELRDVGAANPWEIFYRRDREEAKASVPRRELDVARAWRDLFSLAGSRGEKASLACAGSYGDSGCGVARGALCLEGAARDAQMAAGYESLRYSRETVRLPVSDSVGDGSYLVGMQTAFDGRSFLPPFLPGIRDEDCFFAFLFRVLHPGERALYPAFGFLHQPEEPRSFSRADLVAFRPSLAQCLMALSVSCVPPASMADRASRYAFYADRLSSCAALGAVEFTELVHGVIAQNSMAYAAMLEGLLDRYGRRPAQWAADVDELLENVYERAREPSLLFGPEGCGLDADAARSYAGNYARAVAQWPELWAHVGERGAASCALARRL